MDINLIKYQKSSVTYSTETISSTLNGVHTVKIPLTWTPSDNITYEWLKINFYHVIEINNILVDYDGDCDSLKLEYSNDNENWNVLTDTWLPERKYFEIGYSPTKELIFLRLQVNNPSSFVLNDIEVYSDVSWENTDIISHNYFALYGLHYREKYPVFPSMMHDRLKMYENYNNIDLSLFNASDYENTAVSCAEAPAGSGTLSVSDLTTITDVIYVWDYDDPNEIYASGSDGSASAAGNTLSTDEDLSAFAVNEFSTKYVVITSGINEGSYIISANTNASSGNTITITTTFPLLMTSAVWKIQEMTEVSLAANPNIIISSDPVVDPVDHIYEKTGTYYPRLMIKAPKYQLEFNAKFVKI